LVVLSAATKRVLDVVGSSLGLILLSPFLLAVAVVIRITMGRPILFRQMRPGLDGRLFLLYKFRTMNDTKDTEGQLLPDDERLESLGRFLRRTSFDETPELINVLKGEMSLTGPRPLLIEYLDLYTPDEGRRHLVKPGITGWAQVNGRNALTWDEKFALDLWYVDNRTIGLDLKILWLTLLKVLKREGISAEGHATMPPFRGTQETTES
jgi:sugar transferase EpsL